MVIETTLAATAAMSSATTAKAAQQIAGQAQPASTMHLSRPIMPCLDGESDGSTWPPSGG